MIAVKLKKTWLNLLNVRNEESGLVGFFFLHHFFLGLGLALFFTVASTFFLSRFPVDFFPMVFMLSALAMMVSGRIYSYFEHNIDIKKLLQWVVLFLIGLTIIFRFAYGLTELIILPILLMIGFRIVYLLINLEFWGLSSLVFDVRQGKRLFGLISAGDIPAKLLGYAAVYLLVPFINLENLLVIGAFSFFVSYHFLDKILKSTEISVKHDHTEAKNFSDKNILMSYFGNKFILSVASLGFLIVIVFTLIEYVFLSSVQSQYSNEKELASFLSIFFAVGYFFTLMIKSVLSGRFCDKVGLKNSLLLLPSIVFILSIVFIFYGNNDSTRIENLLFIGILTMLFGVIKYSIDDPMFLVLFQPLPPHLRLKGHSVIKGFIQPLAFGLVGLVLWIINALHGNSNFYYLNFGLLVVSLFWILSVLITNKHYINTLSYAIRKRFISGANIAVKDEVYYKLLVDKIRTGNSQEIAYAISVLSNSNPVILKQEIGKLLKSEDELILDYSIDAIKKYEWVEFSDDLFKIFLNHNKEKIKAVAANVYARLYLNAFDNLFELIDSQSLPIKRAIISGLIIGGNPDSKKASQFILENLIRSDKRRDKIQACKIICELEDERYADSILQFLNEQDEGLVREAIIAAGKIKNEQLLNELFGLLNKCKWKNEIILSLSGFKAVVNKINEFYTIHPDLSVELALDYIKILDRVKNADAIIILIQFLEHNNHRVKDKAVATLSSFTSKDIIEYSAYFEKYLTDQFHLAYVLIAAKEKKELTDSMISVLNFELDKILKRIFSLLSLNYNKEIVRKAETAVHLSNRESKANALEILDNLIPKKIHLCLTALVDDIENTEKLIKLKIFSKTDFDEPISDFILKNANKHFNNYTIAIALNQIIINENNIADLIPFLSNANSLIKQCAEQSLINYNKNNLIFAKSIFTKYNISIDMIESNDSGNRLSELEKIIVLKSTDLFSDTPENIIAELSSIVEERIVAKDELIFKKGDPGSSMYIIYNGEIRIHDGDNTFAVLQNLNFFGELALLDPEPRSASATALKDSLLFRIDQEAAYELMEDRSEVLKSMMTILCRRIRAQNEKLASAIQH